MLAIRLRWWEIVLLIPFTGIAVLLLIGGQVVGGIVVAALLAIVVVARAQIRERNVAGGFARTKGLLLLLQAFALLAIYIVLVWMFWVIKNEHWTRDRPGRVAFWALAGLSFFLIRETYRLAEQADKYILGSDMEREVAALLDPLRSEDWVVIHDIPRPGGNVDHFVNRPARSYAIETKTGRNRAASRNQAISNAVWAKEQLGVRWVTAVLCVGTDPPDHPVKQGHAWVVGTNDLVNLIREQR